MRWVSSLVFDTMERWILFSHDGRSIRTRQGRLRVPIQLGTMYVGDGTGTMYGIKLLTGESFCEGFIGGLSFGWGLWMNPGTGNQYGIKLLTDGWDLTRWRRLHICWHLVVDCR